MYYFIDIQNTLTNTIQRHIVQPLDSGGFQSWPLNNDNPNKAGLDEWLAKGNTLTEWTPTHETPGAS